MSQIKVSISQSKYKTVLSNGRHQLVADEPQSLEGTDLGPTPHELLLMSLGSCVAITLRMYANRKEWPLEEVKISLSQEKEGITHLIKKEIKLIGGLSEKQRQRLMQVSERCPVQKTLLGNIKIDTVEIENS